MTRRMPVVLALAALAPLAQANDPISYSYWDVQYLNSAIEVESGAEDEVEGMRSQLSIGLAPYVNFIGDWDVRRYADGRDSFVSAGLGTHTQHPDYQFFGAVTYERYDVDDNTRPPTGPSDIGNEGFGVQLGVRARLPDLELHASYKYYDLSDGDELELTGGRYGGGLALQLSPWWALVGDYTVRTSEYELSDGSDADEVEFSEWSVGFRRYFATETDRRLRKGGFLTNLGADDDADADAAEDAE